MSKFGGAVVMRTADIIAAAVGEDNIIDIGRPNSGRLGVSESTFSRALQYLETKGYKRFYLNPKQLGMKKRRAVIRVFTKDNVTFADVMNRRTEIRPLNAGTFKSGDKVVVQNSLLYTGRTGLVEEIPESKRKVEMWDYYVILAAKGENDERLIGVNRDQIRPL